MPICVSCQGDGRSPIGPSYSSIFYFFAVWTKRSTIVCERARFVVTSHSEKILLAQYVRTLKSATLCKLGARAWTPPRRRRGETRALKLDDAISILPNRETDYAFHNIDRSYRRLCFKSCRNFAVKTNRMENRWNFHRK